MDFSGRSGREKAPCQLPCEIIIDSGISYLYYEMGRFSIPKGVPNKRYIGQFKQMVEEAIICNKMSYREAAKQSGTPSVRMASACHKTLFLFCVGAHLRVRPAVKPGFTTIGGEFTTYSLRAHT